MNLMQSQKSQKSPSMTPGSRLYFVGVRRDERNTVRQIGCFLRKSKGES